MGIVILHKLTKVRADAWSRRTSVVSLDCFCGEFDRDIGDMVVVVVVVKVDVGHHFPLSIFGTPVFRLPDRHKAATAAMNAVFI